MAQNLITECPGRKIMFTVNISGARYYGKHKWC